MKNEWVFLTTLLLVLSPILKANIADSIVTKNDNKGEVVFSLFPPFENGVKISYHPEPTITGIGWGDRDCNVEVESGKIEQTAFTIADWFGVACIDKS